MHPYGNLGTININSALYRNRNTTLIPSVCAPNGTALLKGLNHSIRLVTSNWWPCTRQNNNKQPKSTSAPTLRPIKSSAPFCVKSSLTPNNNRYNRLWTTIRLDVSHVYHIIPCTSVYHIIPCTRGTPWSWLSYCQARGITTLTSVGHHEKFNNASTACCDTLSLVLSSHPPFFPPSYPVHIWTCPAVCAAVCAAVHPVSVLIQHPREIKIMWSKTELQKKKKNREGIIKVRIQTQW